MFVMNLSEPPELLATPQSALLHTTWRYPELSIEQYHKMLEHKLCQYFFDFSLSSSTH